MDRPQPIPQALEGLYTIDTNSDRVLRLVSRPRCRYLLSRLQAQNQPVAIQDLAKNLCTWEAPGDLEAASLERAQPMLTAIYHNHAPKMQQLDLVEFNQHAGTLQLTDTGERVCSTIELPAVSNSE